MQNRRKAQALERINQLRDEINGLARLATGKTAELASMTQELTDLGPLKEKNLVSTVRYNSLFRDWSRMQGEVGQVEADIARNKGRISETELQILELDDRFRTEALNELQSLDAELTQLTEKRRSVEDKRQRLEIRSPANGRVHELAVRSTGGVIRPGDTVLSIVPDADRLVIEVKIRPRDIDQVAESMRARVLFTAFNRRTTPEFAGKVISISADQSAGSENQEPYFKVRVALKSTELARNILPGMPAEVMITSASRTVISFLLKPVSDQLGRAMRER